MRFANAGGNFTKDAESCISYRFNDSITSLQNAEGVDVTFRRSAPRAFDLVIGANGIHSNVRKLAFGPEADYIHFLGYYYALAKLPSAPGKEDLIYNEPGRMASTGGPKAPAFFVFASEPLQYERDSVEQQQRLLTNAYRGGAWQIPHLMQGLSAATEFYMD